jgi:hypothetical protein
MSVYFLVYSSHLFFEIFPFPVCTAQFIGDWLENRRGTPNSFKFILLYVRCAISNGAGGICAPKIFKLSFADFFSCSVRHYYWRRVHRCANILADYKEDDCVRCASPSYQSPINCALQTGNGNTLKKRRWLHKNINRHRSPRSGTIF